MSVKNNNLLQIQEIQRHKYLESEKRGYDVGEDWAAMDWIQNHSKKWREEREELEEKIKKALEK